MNVITIYPDEQINIEPQEHVFSTWMFTALSRNQSLGTPITNPVTQVIGLTCEVRSG